MQYFAGHTSRFNDGRKYDAIEAHMKNRNEKNVGRYTPALPAHCPYGPSNLFVVVPSSSFDK